MRNTLFSTQKSCLFILICMVILFQSCDDKEYPKLRPGKNWPVYLGDKHNSHHSPLTQINRENVSQLQVAWEYKTGDADPNGHTQIQCNPIIIDGTLYGSSPKLKIFALDAATGKQKWIYDPAVATNFSMNVNRGVTYWEDGDDKRILFTAGPYLFALNADTGYPIQTFGIFGKASLKSKLGEWAQKLYVVSTTPGIIFGDLLILGTRVSEGAIAAPGYIRAYNVKTGKVQWTFRTIPKPGEFGYDTWEERL